MMAVLAWWLLSFLLGGLAWPIAWRMFGRLPDRGSGMARVLGILAGSYLFWLGGNLGWLPTDSGGALLSLVVLAGVAWAFARGNGSEMISWLKAHRRYLLSLEALFLVAFALWAFVRASNPAITATEKPMELAFLNAILRSESYPPYDPWLSGYAISYYYFGYVMLAFLALLTGTPAGVAFNVGNAMWFAMVATASYSLVYNLLASRRDKPIKPFGALLGPLFVLITGNLEALLDVLHARGLFWAVGPDGSPQSPFWRWIGLEELEFPPPSAPSWIPTRSSWWWWRASRVIRELDLQGRPIGLQAIDEFPFFSFLLADNHPHLLAMPFVLMAIAFALQVFLGPGARVGTWRLPFDRRVRDKAVAAVALAALLLGVVSVAGALGTGLSGGHAVLRLIRAEAAFAALLLVFGLVVWFSAGRGKAILAAAEFLFAAWIFGALAFLNAWDFPIYLTLLLGVLFWHQRKRPPGRMVVNLLAAALGLIGAGVLLYLPWYPGFASQAAGILPHLLHPTRPLHFFIMFGVSLIPLVAWMVMRLAHGWERGEWRWLLGIGLGLPAGLLILMLFYAGLIYLAIDPVSLEYAFSLMGVSTFGQAVASVLAVRLAHSGTAILLGLVLAGGAILLRRLWRLEDREGPVPFILLLILIGGLLVLGPEFFYLRDQFGLRMNTIFKFYFAAWILWGLAAAYATAQILERRGGRWIPVQILILLLLAAGLLYPVLATWTKTNGFDPPEGRTLNGALHPSYTLPSDREAIRWMNANLEPGVVAEAVGGSYTYYGRVSVHTGFPTVLGWPGHESQWRGGAREMGNREADIRTLYQSTGWPETRAILETYGIRYVYVGELERSAYRPIFEGKFEAFLEHVYQNEAVAIYAMPEGGLP